MLFPSQSEANLLLNMPKHYRGALRYKMPSLGQALHIELLSDDLKEKFILDVTSHRINLDQRTFQSRARQSIVLARLDLHGPPHRNPDGTELPCPHLHLYREGFADKWALPLPGNLTGIENPLQLLDKFMDFCHIITKPEFESDLFT